MVIIMEVNNNLNTNPLTVVLTDKQYWKSKERCIECHEQDAFTLNGRSLCGVCAEKERLRKAKEYQNNGEVIRKRDQIAYEARKKMRLCVKCGKPLEDGNHRVRCLRCTRKQSIAEHIKLENEAPKVRNYPRGDNGICYVCNQRETFPDRRCCAKCYQWLRESMLNARKSKETKHGRAKEI